MPLLSLHPHLFLLLLLGLTIILPAHASPIDIEPESTRQLLEPDLYYQVETTPLSIDQLLNQVDAPWKALPDGANFGYTETPHWYRIQLKNTQPTSQNRLLEIAYPLLDHIEFYDVYQGHVIQSYETGDSKPFSQRPIRSRTFLFPVSLAPGERHDIYLRIKTAGAHQLPLALWQERAFHEDNQKSLLGRAMFYGMLLIMATFNLFLYFSLRERAHLYYVLMILSTFVLMTSLHGFAFEYFYPDSTWLQEKMLLLIVPLCQIFLCLFTTEFLSLRTLRPHWHRGFMLLIGIALLSCILAFILPYSISTRLSVFMTIPVCLSAVLASMILWKNGEKSARFFSIAWLSLLTGILVTVLNKIGVLPSLFLTEHAIPIGSTLEALLLSFALADRFNREKEARFHVQQELLKAMHQRQDAETRLLHAASHHALSGLPNRLIFEEKIQSWLDQPNEPGLMAIVLLHLRHFDDVNKTLGHQNADTLIQQIAQRLNSEAASYHALLIEQTPQMDYYAVNVEGVTFACAIRGTTRDDVIAMVKKIGQGMSRPMEFMGLSLDFGLVIGCAFPHEQDHDVPTLLRQAFIAFDRADMDSSGVAVYSSDMNPYSPRRLTLMTELRTAIEKDQLALHFQPQIHLSSRRIAGFEALLRWSHPEYGFIPPDEFIPMAEQTGLIRPLTRWVIARALDFCQDLNELHCDANVSVNISAVNLREPNFCDEVCALLETHRIAPNRLALEVTETAAMTDPKSALSELKALQAAHIRLSIDDFGTGHSSLAYIRKLPVQEIKIDRSFVMEMDSNRDDATIVRTTINMCHDLGYEVVAEGVENETTLQMLQALGCDMAQGYHIARPMDRDKLLEWLSRTDWVLQQDKHVRPT